MRRLIVNADDFGLTGGINRAIAALHAIGALTSATLMAASPRFDEACALATQCPSLGIGCHIVLVDGVAVSNLASIPSLIGPASKSAEFRPTLGAFASDLFLGHIRLQDIEREAAAQIRHLQQAGIAVTHIDTHKHTHIFPRVLDAVMRAAAACGIRAIRNPFEPAWSKRATPGANLLRKMQMRVLDTFHRNFRKRVSEMGFATTDGCLGVLATGTLDECTLRSILGRLPEGTWELVCHPAYIDEELRASRTRLQESRAVELSALRSLPRILPGLVTQIHFGALQQ